MMKRTVKEGINGWIRMNPLTSYSGLLTWQAAEGCEAIVRSDGGQASGSAHESAFNYYRLANKDGTFCQT